jgi:hypothetical protein
MHTHAYTYKHRTHLQQAQTHTPAQKTQTDRHTRTPAAGPDTHTPAQKTQTDRHTRTHTHLQQAREFGVPVRHVLVVVHDGIDDVAQ